MKNDALKNALQGLDADEATTIKNAYYQAIEGLAALKEALDLARYEPPTKDGWRAVQAEYDAAEAAEKALDASHLGEVL